MELNCVCSNISIIITCEKASITNVSLPMPENTTVAILEYLAIYEDKLNIMRVPAIEPIVMGKIGRMLFQAISSLQK